MNMPACLEQYDSKNLPPSVVEKIHVLSSGGGIDSAEQNLSLLENYYTRNKESLAAVWETLRKEERQDAQYRQKYGSSWTRLSSSEANKSWRNTLQTYEEYLSTSLNLFR
ncbi:hypothetical protein MXB_4116 [Myxobolus squamalis]|nr:hypothetical protein MXB_4116 [Myxobolus squamalis]